MVFQCRLWRAAYNADPNAEYEEDKSPWGDQVPLARGHSTIQVYPVHSTKPPKKAFSTLAEDHGDGQAAV